MFTKKSILGCIASVMVFSAGMVAKADCKVYPGAACVPHSGSGKTLSYGGIGNTSNGTLSVNCPAVNDTSSTIESVWFTALDKNNGANISCSIQSFYRQAGSSLYYGEHSAYQNSSGYGTNWQKITINEDVLGNSDTSAFLACHIPPATANGNSYIHGYKVCE